ncbi:MAG: urease accessory protein UreF [Roseibacillus sp.]
MSKEDYDWLGLVLTFSDTASPVGGYAHSFGLEGMVQAGEVSDEESLRRFLERDVRESLRSVELPLVARAYRAAIENKADEVKKWDAWAWAMRPTGELREAGAKVGRQQWKLFERTWAEEEAKAARGWFASFQMAPVAGVIFAKREVPLEAGLMVVCYQTYSALMQAALKLLPVGPMATQRLLFEVLGEARALGEEALAVKDSELGTFNPIWDCASSGHERVEARLFLS